MKLYLVFLALITAIACDCACDFKGCGPQADCTDSCCKCNGIGICDPSGCCDGSCIRSVDCCYGCTCTSSACGGTPGFHTFERDQLMMMKMDALQYGGEPPSPPKLPDRWNATVITEFRNVYMTAADYTKKMSWTRIDHAGQEEIIVCQHSKGKNYTGICYKALLERCIKHPERYMIPQEPIEDPVFKGIVWFKGKRLHHWSGFWQVPEPAEVEYYSYEKGDIHIPYFVVIEDITKLEFKDFTVDDVVINIPRQC